MTDDLRTGLARALETADHARIPDGYAPDMPDDISDWAAFMADAAIAHMNAHMQSDAMVNAVVHAIEREIDIQELVSCSPEQLRKIRSKRIARAVLSSIGEHHG